MNILLSGIGLFCAAFLLHFLIWRIKKPASSIKILVLIFVLTLGIGLALLPPVGFIGYFYISFLYLSLFIAYLLAYPAIEVDSPSLVIVMRICEAGTEGLETGKLEEFSGDELLVTPRIKDLVDSGLVDYLEGRYRINKKGTIFIAPFIIYRNFLGLGKGG